MIYDFYCDEHNVIDTVRAPMSEGPTTPFCPFDEQPMTRRYSAPRIQSYYNSVEYVDQAYRGEIAVPSIPVGNVRAMVDAQYGRRSKGRTNAREYKTAK